MRKLIAHLILTLDGVVKFDVVGEPVGRLRDTTEVLDDFFAVVDEEDAMLLGRVTYQEWNGYWPTSTVEPFASHINRVAKFVASESLTSVSWGSHGNIELLTGNVLDRIGSLKQQPGKNIGIHGSPTLVESLLHENLLDELRLEVYPVVAGSGGRLFNEGRAPKELHLQGARATANGVVIATYRTSA